MPDVPASSRLAVRTPSVGYPLRRVHPCIARPDLYPVVGPRVAVGHIHDFALQSLWGFLKQHLERTPHAPHYHMAGNVYLHAEGGGRRVAPDVTLYLAPRVPSSGLSFAVEYDGSPDLVLEMPSEEAWKKDAGVGAGLDDKKRFYAECDVREYWIYDPEGHRPDGGPVLQGFRLHAKQYREIASVTEDELWWSDALQTHWGLTPFHRYHVPRPYAQLRVRDPETGTWYATERQRAREERRQNKARLATRDAQIAEKDAQIAARDAQIAEKDARLAARDAQIAEKDAQIAHLKRQLGLDASGVDDRAES